ncbi:hypothetical protein NSND_63232 [Nitrospira sp. ND1]|nr:hypothetical protein NSND_63232 [Nitrospira sp. ND1]
MASGVNGSGPSRNYRCDLSWRTYRLRYNFLAMDWKVLKLQVSQVRLMADSTSKERGVR